MRTRGPAQRFRECKREQMMYDIVPTSRRSVHQDLTAWSNLGRRDQRAQPRTNYLRSKCYAIVCSCPVFTDCFKLETACHSCHIVQEGCNASDALHERLARLRRRAHLQERIPSSGYDLSPYHKHQSDVCGIRKHFISPFYSFLPESVSEGNLSVNRRWSS